MVNLIAVAIIIFGCYVLYDMFGFKENIRTWERAILHVILILVVAVCVVLAYLNF
jgi:hypothetical protein